VFNEVDPQLAVYSHLVMLSGPTIPQAPLPSLITRTRTNYDGPLVIGEDLMSFIIDDKVSIYRAAR
jgi:ribonuclease Z